MLAEIAVLCECCRLTNGRVTRVCVCVCSQRVSLDDLPDDDDDDVDELQRERSESSETDERADVETAAAAQDDEDDDVKRRKSSGCLPRPSSAPAAGQHHSQQTATSHHSMKLADKLLRFFHRTATGQQHCGVSRRQLAASSCRGTAGGRHRRFMRVVKDEQAPPPERVADNPNIICRYSQARPTTHTHTRT